MLEAVVLWEKVEQGCSARVALDELFVGRVHPQE
jgi:hypothetical protein